MNRFVNGASDPKTTNSIRIVDLSDNLIELLIKYKENCKKIDGFKESSIVFGTIRYIPHQLFKET